MPESACSWWLFAMAEGRKEPIGVVGVIEDADKGPHVASMWVEPRYRKQGVARQLMDAVCRQLSISGYSEVYLWVLDGNDDARQVYERMGFASTDERKPLRTGRNCMEERMLRPLHDWVGSPEPTVVPAETASSGAPPAMAGTGQL